MASYQVPQFLDSGDKIFLSMNIRQFGYALVGFFATLGVYSIFNRIFPTFGPYNMFWGAPLMLLALYLALGRFNGRDTEVYVFKSIIFFTKPRVMRYQKDPDFSDINAKLKELTEAKIEARWNESVAALNPTNTMARFNEADSTGKIAQIKRLGSLVDGPTVTTFSQIKAKELEMARTEQLIKLVSDSARATKKGVPLPQDYLSNALLDPAGIVDSNDPYDSYNSTENFLKIGKFRQ